MLLNKHKQDALNRIFTGIALIAVLWFLNGCAQVLDPGTMAGAGELYRYTTTNTVKKTFVGTMDQVSAAAKIALEKMKMGINKVNRMNTETVLHASASEFNITIHLEPVTPATTRTTVNVTKGHLIKDKATAEQILSQIDKALSKRLQDTKPFSSVFIKNKCDQAIKAAVYYFAGSEGSKRWETKGWFYIESGHIKHIVDTPNTFIYFYAESRKGRPLFWAGDQYRYFNGSRYGFFKVDMGSSFIDFTQSFTCD